MNVLFDTNVCLDALLKREPYSADAIQLLALSETGVISGYVSASAVTDIHYISGRLLKDKALATQIVKSVLSMVDVAVVDGDCIYSALALDWDDFEDAVQYVVAENLEADYFITRNTKDFAPGAIPVLTPMQFLSEIDADG